MYIVYTYGKLIFYFIFVNIVQIKIILLLKSDVQNRKYRYVYESGISLIMSQCTHSLGHYDKKTAII